ncbi:hypothetical protein COO60DRAFT_692092 [Scenedesmus sp. NREL 46B-D3]|nr:hypothetical protein COO60DRAFT_692092 [Scenedesmus sp. NREL 46B-D3]
MCGLAHIAALAGCPAGSSSRLSVYRCRQRTNQHSAIWVVSKMRSVAALHCMHAWQQSGVGGGLGMWQGLVRQGLGVCRLLVYCRRGLCWGGVLYSLLVRFLRGRLVSCRMRADAVEAAQLSASRLPANSAVLPQQCPTAAQLRSQARCSAHTLLAGCFFNSGAAWMAQGSRFMSLAALCCNAVSVTAFGVHTVSLPVFFYLDWHVGSPVPVLNRARRGAMTNTGFA